MRNRILTFFLFAFLSKINHVDAKIENKIILKIENEIITNYEVKNKNFNNLVFSWRSY